ncbi:MAG: hypothetical protein HUJ75_06135, partial [Parasporobacterium sp.]|nr:hypothetical protein [Parasporobacterium sp.]
TYAGTAGCPLKKGDGSDNITVSEASDKALAAAKALASSLGAIINTAAPEVPDALPVRPETAEGALDRAGTISLLIYHNKVNAYINKNTVSTGALNVTVRNTDDLSADADASAVTAADGAAAAAALISAETLAKAYVTGVHSAASMNILSGMTKTLDEQSNPVDAVNSVSSEVQSGAGAAVPQVAGALAIVVYSPVYEALAGNGSSEPAVITLGTGDSSIKAEQSTDLSVYAGAETGTSGVSLKSGTVGYGPGFAADFFEPSVKALICTGSSITSEGNVSVTSSTENNIKASASAGNDCFSGNQTVTDAAVALNMINSAAQAEVETGASLTTDGSLELTSYGKTGAYAETKGAAQAANVMAGASTA